MKWLSAIQCGKQVSNMSFHLGHRSAPWYTPTKHKQKNFCTHFDLPTGNFLLPGLENAIFFPFLVNTAEC